LLAFLIIIISVTLLSSAVILSKYIDFAKCMLERKERNLEPRIVQFNQPKTFKKRAQQDIIIDIPVREVKVLENKD